MVGKDRRHFSKPIRSDFFLATTDRHGYSIIPNVRQSTGMHHAPTARMQFNRRERHIFKREWWNGRHARFRILWGNPWEFESPFPHQISKKALWRLRRRAFLLRFRGLYF